MMKNLTISSGIIFLTSCLLLGNVDCCFAAELSLKIEASKTRYSSEEDVPISAKITCRGDYPADSVTIPAVFIPEDYYIRFVITDINGSRVKFIGPEYDYRESSLDLYRLSDGYFVGSMLNLAEYYELGSGDFTVQAIFEVQANRRKEGNIWTGKLESNSIQIKIE